MKKHIIKYLLVVSLPLTFLGCNDYHNSVGLDDVVGDSIASTYTIAQVKSTFLTSTNLFSVQQIQSQEDVIINGVITSDDDAGNIYKYIVVQEQGENGQALKISIDAGSLSGIYKQGQRVAVRLNDLWIGKYAQAPQIGVYYLNEKKGREEPGRIPKPISDLHIFAYGMPDASLIQPKEMTIAEIVASGSEIYNKLVKIKNATFTGKGANYGKPATISASEKIFAPSTNGVGYPQSREITDGTGSIFVSTSEYARFASVKLPSGTGDVVAIVGWYNDKDATIDPTKIYWQLTLRSLDDLTGFTWGE